jgi:tetratricopeptide (TPR) repeat protein
MKKAILATGLLLFIFTSGWTIDPDTLYRKANDAYTNGFFLEAIDQYLTIVDHGYESADLYFNIGNACFKLEDYPSAILYYEKAKKLAPNDDDILFNLALANTRIIDKIEPVPELFFKTWWRSLTYAFGLNTWAYLGVAAFILFFVLLALYLLSRNIRIRKTAFFTGLAVLLFAVFSFAVAFQRYQTFQTKKEAIVFTPTITVKSSPNQNSVDLFVIHEGAKVEIRDQVGEWIEIRIANGSVGWLPNEAVRRI